MPYPRHFGQENCVVLPFLSLILTPPPLPCFFFNPKPLKGVVLINVIAFSNSSSASLPPFQKWGEGLRRMMVEGEALCVFGKGHGEMDMRSVSAYPAPLSADSTAGLRAVRGDLMAQAPDSSCALLLSSPQPFTPSNDARVCSPEAPGVFDLHPSLPPPHTAPSPPPTRLSGISAIPPPSAGSEPPKGRLPSPQLQVTNGRKAGLRRLRAKLGAARRQPLPQCAPLGAPAAEPLRGG